MTYVVQNEWKFDKDRLKLELHKILEKNDIEDKIVGSLHGISLMSQDGSIYNGFNFNVGLQDPSYPEQDKTDHNPTVYFKLSYAREHKIYHMLDYNIETSACTGYFKEIIDFLKYNMRSQVFAKSLQMQLVVGAIKRLVKFLLQISSKNSILKLMLDLNKKS